MISTNKNIINKLKKDYPIGTRIVLVKMDDVQAPPAGTKGTVKGVDDTGSLLVSWDNGSSLNVIYNVDKVEKVEENKMMNYNEFVHKVAENIINYMPEEFSTVSVKIYDTYKNNDTHRVGIILENGNCRPVLYLETFYEKYLNGNNVRDLYEEIANVYLEVIKTKPLVSSNDFTWDSLKTKVFPFVVNRKNNEEYIKNYLFKPFSDLIIVYKAVLENYDEGIATVPITQNLLNSWGMTLDELDKQAMKNNNNKIPELLNMCEMMAYLYEESYEEPINYFHFSNKLTDIPMFILKNDDTLGASVLTNKAALDHVCDILEDDLIILPSSVHELIVLRKSAVENLDGLQETICDVNDEVVASDEVLSDHPYIYSKENGLTF